MRSTWVSMLALVGHKLLSHFWILSLFRMFFNSTLSDPSNQPIDWQE